MQPEAEEAQLVVVVDDDTSVRRSTCRLIRSFRYRAAEFGSGEEFLSSDLALETACLLLDVRMPGMDGLEVQRRLAERGRRIPIVFFTAQANEQEERRARAAGAVEFLRKPVDETRLRDALDSALRASDRAQGDRDGS